MWRQLYSRDSVLGDVAQGNHCLKLSALRMDEWHLKKSSLRLLDVVDRDIHVTFGAGFVLFCFSSESDRCSFCSQGASTLVIDDVSTWVISTQ